MASVELEKLFDAHAEEEAQSIVTAALASRRYRLEMKAAVTLALLIPVLLCLLIFWANKSVSPPVPVRLLSGLLCVGFIFLGSRAIHPINDRLVDRAIRRQLASRGTTMRSGDSFK